MLRHLFKLFGPLLILAVLFSLVFHYVFIHYFPDEWLSKLFTIEQNQQQYFRVTSNINITLEGEAVEGEQTGTGEGVGGDTLDGLDKEKWGDLIDRLENNTGFKDVFNQDNDVINQDSQVSKSYIHRERHHEDIVVKEVFPTIYTIDSPFEKILKTAPETFTEYEERNEIIERYRHQESQEKIQLNLEAHVNQQGKNPEPLYFPEAERRAYFDRTLKGDKTDQLADFIRQYFHHDPNEGDLAIATRELYFENLERLLYTFSSDPTYLYLDFYLENLNKEDFLNNALNQAAQLHGSKTATELLFAVERIYEIQQRAWKAYFDFDSLFAGLSAQKKTYLRVETLRRVNERYKSVLREKNIKDYNDIETLYRERRYQILDYIVQQTPDAYRKQDAVFERAVVLWEMGLQQQKPELQQRAVEDWQGLILEAKQHDFYGQGFNSSNATHEISKDFYNLQHLRMLDALLMAYESESQLVRKKSRENQISTFLQQRQHQRLSDKYEREARLLWPLDGE